MTVLVSVLVECEKGSGPMGDLMPTRADRTQTLAMIAIAVLIAALMVRAAFSRHWALLGGECLGLLAVVIAWRAINAIADGR